MGKGRRMYIDVSNVNNVIKLEMGGSSYNICLLSKGNNYFIIYKD